jgi:hypothetical protein
MLSICDLHHMSSAFPLSMVAFDAIFRIVVRCLTKRRDQDEMRMKSIIVMLFTCTLLALSAGRAEAFIHYTQNTFTTAESLDPGLTQMGVFFILR